MSEPTHPSRPAAVVLPYRTASDGPVRRPGRILFVALAGVAWGLIGFGTNVLSLPLVVKWAIDAFDDRPATVVPANVVPAPTIPPPPPTPVAPYAGELLGPAGMSAADRKVVRDHLRTRLDLPDEQAVALDVVLAEVGHDALGTSPGGVTPAALSVVVADLRLLPAPVDQWHTVADTTLALRTARGKVTAGRRAAAFAPAADPSRPWRFAFDQVLDPAGGRRVAAYWLERDVQSLRRQLGPAFTPRAGRRVPRPVPQAAARRVPGGARGADRDGPGRRRTGPRHGRGVRPADRPHPADRARRRDVPRPRAGRRPADRPGAARRRAAAAPAPPPQPRLRPAAATYMLLTLWAGLLLSALLVVGGVRLLIDCPNARWLVDVYAVAAAWLSVVMVVLGIWAGDELLAVTGIPLQQAVRVSGWLTASNVLGGLVTAGVPILFMALLHSRRANDYLSGLGPSARRRTFAGPAGPWCGVVAGGAVVAIAAVLAAAGRAGTGETARAVCVGGVAALAAARVLVVRRRPGRLAAAAVVAAGVLWVPSTASAETYDERCRRAAGELAARAAADPTAAEALGRLGAPGLPALLDLVATTDVTARVELLARAGPALPRGALGDAGVAGPARRVVPQLLEVLSALHTGRAGRQTPRSFNAASTAACGLLTAAGPDAVDAAWAAVLSDPAGFGDAGRVVRRLAANAADRAAAAEFGPTAITPFRRLLLVAAAADPGRPHLRTLAAARLLPDLTGDEPHADRLLGLLRDPDPAVVKSALDAAGAWRGRGHPKLRAALEPLAHDRAWAKVANQAIHRLTPPPYRPTPGELAAAAAGRPPRSPSGPTTGTASAALDVLGQIGGAAETAVAAGLFAWAAYRFTAGRPRPR